MIFSSCSEEQKTSINEQKLINCYIKNRILDKKKDTIVYINKLGLNKDLINRSIIGAQELSKNFNQDISLEIKQHLSDTTNTSYYLSQINDYNLIWDESKFNESKVIVYDFERDKSNKKLSRKASYLLKTISHPLLSKNQDYALMLEMSQNGCFVFVYKKIRNKWIEIESITTCY